MQRGGQLHQQRIAARVRVYGVQRGLVDVVTGCAQESVCGGNVKAFGPKHPPRLGFNEQPLTDKQQRGARSLGLNQRFQNVPSLGVGGCVVEFVCQQKIHFIKDKQRRRAAQRV